MTVRKRLAALYIAVLAGLFLLFSIGLYVSFRYHLGAEVDGSLASWSLQILDSDGSGRLRIPAQAALPSGRPYRDFEMRETFVAVYGMDGKLLLDRSSFSDGGLESIGKAVAEALPQERGVFRNLELEGQAYRVLLKRVSDSAGESASIALGRSLVHVDQSIRGLVLSLIFAWSVAVALGSSVMWVLVGQTIRPVNAMTALAIGIAQSKDLKGRIAVGPEKDEFNELGRALNRMLAAIDSSNEAQKQFLADASHELRTPLTSIRTNLGFASNAKSASAADKEAALADCLSEIERMSSLVNELLLLARAEAPIARNAEPLEISEILDSASRSFSDPSDRGIPLDLPERPLLVMGDREELWQAVSMLLDNSRKYSGPEGRVTLRTENRGGSIDIIVEDDGPGVPEDEIDRVIERFYRASNVRERVNGSGLGLAIVKSIILKHGGSIALANRVPRGFVVRLSLPALPG